MAKTESVSVQMKELLDEINLEVKESTKEGIREISKESVQKLRNTSPRKTGSYAKGWAVKRESELEVVVYNRTDWQLTHLLENGHRIVNKKGEYGRVNGVKHIAPVEEWAADALLVKILGGIKG